MNAGQAKVPSEGSADSSSRALALLSAIVDSSDDAIVSKSLEGIITSWNRGAERIFGYTAREAIGKSIRLIIPPERQPEEDYVLAQIAAGRRVDHFETVRQTKDGRRLNISLTVSPIRDENGVVIGASKIARDITEKKRYEAEREEFHDREQAALQRLQEAIQSRDEFIAVAAHELRNPLNVFRLSLQLLDRIAGDPDKAAQLKNLVARAHYQLGRLAALVDRLLDVTQVRSGTFVLYRETFDLSALIREIAARFNVEYPSSRISLNLPPKMEGNWDRLRIDQALTNLISNALKYGREKPVTVTLSVGDACVSVAVLDEGTGIAPRNLERIFDQFERAVPRSDQGGLGLGLWITKQIAETHGGSITVESKVDRGSQFTFRLPL